MRIKVKREFEPSVRYTNGLRIYFKNKHDVEVSSAQGSIIISRWQMRQSNVYRDSWRPFCEKLIKRNTLSSIWEVQKLAQNYGLDVMSSAGCQSIIPENTKIRPEIYQTRRRNV